jgi:hypothetical protein
VRFVENDTLPGNLGEHRIAVVDSVQFGSNDAIGRDDDVVAREPERKDVKFVIINDLLDNAFVSIRSMIEMIGELAGLDAILDFLFPLHDHRRRRNDESRA